MADSLVATKLLPPRPRPGLVPRDGLAPRLAAGAQASLLLVSAPPGFGKTTTLATWMSSSTPVDSLRAWVSLDADDQHPATFWRYVAAALNRQDPNLAAGILALLESGQPPDRHLIAALLNELGDQNRPVLLVLDDYHLADGPGVAEGMTFLIEHRTDNLRLGIGTRADPDLPLARLRARGELVEVRTRDLRFSEEETAAFLADAPDLELSADDVARLAVRTEGWAAALQLAALSLAGRSDPEGFVADFAGTDRHVVDYLADEVLVRQPAHLRQFLSHTSILDVFTGELCDAVLDTHGSAETLRGIESANLFLVPLDDRRRWFRYHHLFADVLRAHLHEQEPDLVDVLHLRASRWFAAADEPAAAVRHALSGHDPDLAVGLAEAAIPELRRHRRDAVLRTWVDTLPPETVTRPVLSLGLVGALMASNEFSDVDRRLREIEAHLPAVRERLDGAGRGFPQGTAVAEADEAELARVPAGVELYRAGLALVTGDLAGTHAHAQLAITRSVADDHLVRAGATGLAGLAHWATGDLAAAHEDYLACIDGLHRARHLPDVLGCTVTLADIRLAQLRVDDAEAAYEQGLALATAGEPVRGGADMHLGRAHISVQRGELDEARESLAQAHQLGEAYGLPQYPYRSRAVAALIAESSGDLLAALDLWTEAQQVYLGDFSPNVAPLAASAARVQVRLGDLDGARRWAGERGLSGAEEVTYLREYELVTLVEILLAEHRQHRDPRWLDDARGLLTRLRDAALAGGHAATLLDVEVLRAVCAHQADDDPTPALLAALELGQGQRWVRPFARLGELLVEPLRTVTVLPEIDTSFMHAVQEACQSPTTQADPRPAQPGTARASAALVDPLTDRELQVLRLLATDLSGPEIARHLYVSLNTVRTHTKNVFTKLAVTSRRAAVRRGLELGLLDG